MYLEQLTQFMLEQKEKEETSELTTIAENEEDYDVIMDEVPQSVVRETGIMFFY